MERVLMPRFIWWSKAKAKYPRLFGDFWEWRDALAKELHKPRKPHKDGLIWE
jgi:hypothetical protein